MKVSILVAITGFVGSISGFPLLGENPWLQNQPCDRVIKLGPEKYEVVTENTKLAYKRANINFIDVTERIRVEDAKALGFLETTGDKSLLDSLILVGSKQLNEIVSPKNYNYPQQIQYDKTVKDLIGNIDQGLMYDHLANFTSFFTRYYKSQTGLESAEWLEQQLLTVAAPVKDSVKVQRVHHKGWDQFSLIATIPGRVDSKVIVGAHQDSINLLLPSLLRAPGADDDGSGTVTVLEAYRVLMDAYIKGDFKPYQTLEFHFYSAEEGGLLGSFDVFNNYYETNETVIGLLQQDMTGYTGNMDPDDIHMGLIGDYTTPGLNNFIKMIISNYCSIPYHETECGYACSDHASAIEHGFPASFVIESEMNLSSKYIHSVYDTIDRIDWDHVKEHTKLTIGYAYELSMSKVKEL